MPYSNDSTQKNSKITMSIKDMEEVTGIYDELHPILLAAAKSSSTWNAFNSRRTKIFEKNSDALTTNFGDKVLINDKDETDILHILGLKKEDVKKLILHSEYFEKFGRELNMTSQLSFAIPLIILSGEYLNLHKDDKAHIVYLTAFIKPYASIISAIFRYCNRDQMQYTIEHLSEKYGIKKEGNEIGVLYSTSLASLLNYTPQIIGRTTDHDLHIIFQSGIWSRIRNPINLVKIQYDKNKGNYLPFEDGSINSTDSEGNSDNLTRDINSDSSVKRQEVIRATNRVLKDPVNLQIIRTALASSKPGSRVFVSDYYITIFSDMINEIIDKLPDKIPTLFESLIGGFLFSKNPRNNMRYTMSDYKTTLFIEDSSKLFVKSNTKDLNTLNAKKILYEMLENCSDYYISSGDTNKRQIRDALLYYFIYLTR